MRERMLVCAALALISSAASAQSVAPDPVYANGFESGVVAFGPSPTYVGEGESNVFPRPTLWLTLSAPVAGATFVPIVSADPTRVDVSGGGVTVAAGQSSAPVPVNGVLAGAAPVSLFATLGNRVGAGVRVEGALNETDSAAEADYCVLQFPASFSVNPTQPAPAIYGRLYEAGSTEAAGAPPGWMAEVGYGPFGTDPRSQRSQWQFFSASYNLQVGSDDEFVASFTAPAAAGSYAYAFRFSQDQGGNWTYCDLDGAGSNPAQTFDLPNLGTMTVMTGLVINEVDYDQPGTDSAEFIEIYNASAQSVSLTGLALALINGSDNSEYRRIDLDAAAATLAAGGYLVVHTPSVTVAPGAVSLLFPAACSSDCIQNGAPDGIALIDSVNGTLIDALSYEGSVLAANIAGFPSPVNLVEGTPATVLDNNTSDGSLVRIPNGSDTNNAVSDWQFATVPTPGAAN